MSTIKDDEEVMFVDLFSRLKEMSACIRSLSNIKRFALYPCIHPQNVAEHSYRVAMLAILITLEYQDKTGKTLSLEEIMLKALCHDCEESINGDIPYDLKRKNADIFARLERKTIKDELFNTNTELKTYCANSKKGVSGFIVELADILEMIFYTMEEIELGNSAMTSLFYKCVNILRKTIDNATYDGFRFVKETVNMISMRYDDV